MNFKLVTNILRRMVNGVTTIDDARAICELIHEMGGIIISLLPDGDTQRKAWEIWLENVRYDQFI